MLVLGGGAGHPLLVTKGGVMRVFLGQVLGLAADSLLLIEVPPACRTRLRIPVGGGGPSLIAHGCHPDDRSPRGAAKTPPARRTGGGPSARRAQAPGFSPRALLAESCGEQHNVSNAGDLKPACGPLIAVVACWNLSGDAPAFPLFLWCARGVRFGRQHTGEWK
jgi:hypothetical protein